MCKAVHLGLLENKSKTSTVHNFIATMAGDTQTVNDITVFCMNLSVLCRDSPKVNKYVMARTKFYGAFFFEQYTVIGATTC